ncbi:hypothetical protein BD779DRAFT_1466158 [Infundibulicybe gibba]|nr:hypothetical protein BD779DRAFT_1466158 [Infundibulicybe gibba]
MDDAESVTRRSGSHQVGACESQQEQPISVVMRELPTHEDVSSASSEMKMDDGEQEGAYEVRDHGTHASRLGEVCGTIDVPEHGLDEIQGDYTRSQLQAGRDYGGGGGRPGPGPAKSGTRGNVESLDQFYGWRMEGRNDDTTLVVRQNCGPEFESGAAVSMRPVTPPGWATSIEVGEERDSNITPGGKPSRSFRSTPSVSGVTAVTRQPAAPPKEPRPWHRTRALNFLTGLLCCSVHVSFHNPSAFGG